jgi:hypothetical protein
MARIAIPTIVGPTNVQAALNADAEDTINFMEAPIPPGQSKVGRWLQGTPGYRPWLNIPTSPIRCMFQQDGRAWVVGGTTFYEIFATPSYTGYTPTIPDDGYLASMASNGSAGNQVMVTSGGLGYIFNTSSNTFAQITDPDFPTDVRMCEFMDGYFFVMKADTRQFNISALEDGTSWDALDVAERSEASDNINALIRNHRVIAIIGSKTSEFWYDNGDSLFPFAPTQGDFVEHGSDAPFTVRRLADTLFWVGRDEDGNGAVWALKGISPTTVSPPAVNRLIQTSGSGTNNDLSLSVAWTYQQDGHSFYCLNLPECEWTLVYDLLTDRWHKRGQWDYTIADYVNGGDRPQCHMHFAGKHLVGDRLSGMIYEMSLDVFDAQYAGATV